MLITLQAERLFDCPPSQPFYSTEDPILGLTMFKLVRHMIVKYTFISIYRTKYNFYI